MANIQTLYDKNSRWYSSFRDPLADGKWYSGYEPGRLPFLDDSNRRVYDIRTSGVNHPFNFDSWSDVKGSRFLAQSCMSRFFSNSADPGNLNAMFSSLDKLSEKQTVLLTQSVGYTDRGESPCAMVDIVDESKVSFTFKKFDADNGIMLHEPRSWVGSVKGKFHNLARGGVVNEIVDSCLKSMPDLPHYSTIRATLEMTLAPGFQWTVDNDALLHAWAGPGVGTGPIVRMRGQNHNTQFLAIAGAPYFNVVPIHCDPRAVELIRKGIIEGYTHDNQAGQYEYASLVDLHVRTPDYILTVSIKRFLDPDAVICTHFGFKNPASDMSLINLPPKLDDVKYGILQIQSKGEPTGFVNIGSYRRKYVHEVNMYGIHSRFLMSDMAAFGGYKSLAPLSTKIVSFACDGWHVLASSTMNTAKTHVHTNITIASLPPFGTHLRHRTKKPSAGSGGSGGGAPHPWHVTAPKQTPTGIHKAGSTHLSPVYVRFLTSNLDDGGSGYGDMAVLFYDAASPMAGKAWADAFKATMMRVKKDIETRFTSQFQPGEGWAAFISRDGQARSVWRKEIKAAIWDDIRKHTKPGHYSGTGNWLFLPVDNTLGPFIPANYFSSDGIVEDPGIIKEYNFHLRLLYQQHPEWFTWRPN